LKKLFISFVHFFIGSLIFFFGSSGFWASCIFWLLTPSQIYSWQRFSFILVVVISSICWPFL
jgi:hypothetical protein